MSSTVTSGSLDGEMVSRLAQNARDVGLIPLFTQKGPHYICIRYLIPHIFMNFQQLILYFSNSSSPEPGKTSLCLLGNIWSSAVLSVSKMASCIRLSEYHDFWHYCQSLSKLTDPCSSQISQGVSIVVFCKLTSRGKELHRQVNMARMMTSESLDGVMVSTLVWNGFDSRSRANVSHFHHPYDRMSVAAHNVFILRQHGVLEPYNKNIDV